MANAETGRFGDVLSNVPGDVVISFRRNTIVICMHSLKQNSR